MAIREEYQHIEAEINKAEERNHKLDLLSVGVMPFEESFIYFETYVYKENGLFWENVYNDICNEVKELLSAFKIKDNNFNLKGLSLPDDLESKCFDDVFHEMLSFYIAILDELYCKQYSAKRQEKEDDELLKRIGNAKAQCEQLLLNYKEAVTNKTKISIDDIQKYQTQIFYKQLGECNLNEKMGRTEANLEKNLSPGAQNDYCDVIRNQLLYENIVKPFVALVFYLFLFDSKAYYRQVLLEYGEKLLSVIPENHVPIPFVFRESNHTIDDVFKLLIKLPRQYVANFLWSFKEIGTIDFLEYSRIIDAINSSDLDSFVQAVNSRFAKDLDVCYFALDLFHTGLLSFQSRNWQERVLSVKRFIRSFNNDSVHIPQLDKLESLISDDANSSHIIADLIFSSPILWKIVGLITHCYHEYKGMLLPADQKYFNRIFLQELNKKFCDKALYDYNNRPNKSILDYLGLNFLFFEMDEEEQQDSSITEANNNSTAVIEGPEQQEREMTSDNPFEGLNREASKQCGDDKKGYVSMFIDYLIYRGYIDVENKDAYVCCLCDAPIPKDTLEHLKYNTTNKEGIKNANIVTLLFGRLTKFTANNQIVVDGKEISRGSIYFNKGQIDNGELEEWCLFWPFLIGRNKEGEEEFKKLFQSSLRSQDSKMEKALKRVTSFIEDYEAAKLQNPDMTKLDFIKMRHELH